MLNAIQSYRPLQNTQTIPQTGAQGPAAPSPAISDLRPVDNIQRTAAIGSIPATLPLFSAQPSVVDSALGKLNSSPTQETARNAQASFRVGIRALDLNSLNQLQASLDELFKSASDYRTQRFLAEIQVDLLMEIHAKGGKPNVPPLVMPPVPGKTPEAVVHGSLKQLSCCPTEANYKTARAGFRVALRALSVEDLARTKALVSAAIQTSSDYRTQAFLDDMLEDLFSEQISRGLKPEPQALNMPPVLGTAPAEIAANAISLLNSNPSEANFRTAVAAVRVAARGLDKPQTAALKAEFVKAMASTSDYRSQVYLDTVARELF